MHLPIIFLLTILLLYLYYTTMKKRLSSLPIFILIALVGVVGVVFAQASTMLTGYFDTRSRASETALGALATIPSQVLDLTSWKLTIPQNTSLNGDPDEIKYVPDKNQPSLKDYTSEYFKVSSQGNSVVFRAHAGGATTGGSNYPRSELREMWPYYQSAAWSNTSGTHSLFVEQAVTALNLDRKHIVVGQIHDADSYEVFYRLEDTKLYIQSKNTDFEQLGSQPRTKKRLIDGNYTLGKRFTIEFVSAQGKTDMYYNGTLVATMVQNISGAYFKAGAYLQASCTYAADGWAKERSCDNYGEVAISALQVCHSGVCKGNRVSPSPSPTLSPTPTASPSPSPSIQPTSSPSPSPTVKPTATPTPRPTSTPSPSPTPQPSPMTGAPVLQSIESPKDSRIVVTWTGVAGADEYRIYISKPDQNGGFYLENTVDAKRDTTVYTRTLEKKSNKRYYIYVTAVDKNEKESAASATLSVMVK